MKRFLITTAAVLAGSAAFAQVSAGPEIGFALNNYGYRIDGDKISTHMKPGIRVGGVVDIMLLRNLYLQPGLMYNNRGYLYKEVYDRSTAFSRITVTDRANETAHFLEMPINLLYKSGSPKSPARFMIGGGPYFAATLAGRYKSSTTTRISNEAGTTETTSRIDDRLYVGNDSRSDDLRPFDVGMNFNMGVQFYSGLYLRGNVGIGFANMLPGGDANNYIHNWGTAFSVGYLFGR